MPWRRLRGGARTRYLNSRNRPNVMMMTAPMNTPARQRALQHACDVAQAARASRSAGDWRVPAFSSAPSNLVVAESEGCATHAWASVR